MFLLTINDGTTTFSYNDSIIEGSPIRSEKTSGREVQLGSVDVTINTSFLSLTDPCALPHPSPCKGYRALLTFNGETIIDGIVYRTSPLYDGRDDLWRIEIVNEAVRDFYDKLKLIEVQNLAINYIEFESFVNNFGFSSIFPSGAEKPKWYAIKDIWKGIISTLFSLNGIQVYSYTTLGLDPNWSINTFTLVQDYPNGQVTRYAEGYLCGSYDSKYESWRNPYAKFSLPKWSGYEFWEFYSKLLGLRVVGEYQTFPECKIKIECFQEINAIRPYENLLDPKLLSSTSDATERNRNPYTLQNTEALYEDFAVAYTNNFGEPIPDSSYTYPTPVYAYGIPAIYGYNEYRVKTEEKVTSPINDDLQSLDVYLPFYLYETVVTENVSGLFNEEVTYGIPILSEGKDEVYLGVWLDTSNPPVVPKMLIQRKWIDGNGDEVYNAEHWATNIMNMYPTSRSQRCTATASFCSDGISLSVGNQVNNFLSDNWVLESFELNPKGQYYENVQLLKVNNDVEWINAGRQPVSPPQNPTSSVITVPFGGGNFRYDIILRWETSTIPTVPTTFEVEHFNGVTNLWTNVSTQTAFAGINIYQTGFIPSTNGINWIQSTFRVRGVNGTEYSDWVIFPIST